MLVCWIRIGRQIYSPICQKQTPDFISSSPLEKNCRFIAVSVTQKNGMQIKNKLILSSWAVLFAAFLFLSNASNPPNGYTGAPGDSLCTSCHTNPPAGVNGSISITGLPATVMPNTTYTITLSSTVSQGTPQTGGFQLVALNASNQNAGDLAPIGTDAGTNTAGGREYIEQRGDKNITGGVVSWMFNWTSPPSGSGTITMYAAANLSNNNNSTSGDRIITNTFSTTLQSGGPALMVAIPNPTHVSCFGGNNGSATAVATGGTSPYTYTWSNGQSGATASNLAASLYTVTVTDAANATATASVTITQPAALVAQVASQTNVNCFGNATGAVTMNGVGGTPPYVFAWSNGQSGPTINNLAAGTYTVTISDSRGCIDTETAVITEPGVLSANAVSTHETGSGANDGTATAAPSGGTEPYSYLWSNGETTPALTGLAPGIYTVTVSDANLCEAIQTVLVNPFGCILSLSFATEDVSCHGGDDGQATAIPADGTEPYTYNWSTGGAGATASGLAAGDYQITVTDASNCIVIGEVSIAEPQPLMVESEIAAQVDCFGASTGIASVLASGGNSGADYTYVWGDTIGFLPPGEPFVRNDLAAGSYTVLVIDGNDCENSITFSITQPSELTMTVVSTDETSNNADDGTATAAAQGGTGNLTYQWSNGQNGASIAGLAPGAYQVTATDENGCEIVGETVVEAFVCDLSLTLEYDDVVCHGEATGAALATPVGGNAPYAYAWSNQATTPAIAGLLPGEYSVTVTDTTNCVAAGTVTISEPAPLEVTAEIISPVQCPDDLSGWAVLTIIGGNSPYQALWPNGGAGISQTSLSGGSHIVTVTDAGGCTAQLEVIIPIDDEEPPVAVAQDLTVFIDENGQAVFSPQDLDGGSTDNCGITAWEADIAQFDCSHLGQNEVTLTVFDGGGNFSSASAVVTVADTLPPVLLCPENILAINDCDGIIEYTVTVADNCGGVDLVLMDGLESGAVFPLDTTTVTWTATDGSGNASMCSFTVTLTEQPVEWDLNSTPSCPNEATGTATAIPSNGTMPFTYLWNDPLAQTTPTATGLAPGTYAVVVTDADGCTATAMLEVGVTSEVEITIVAVADETNGQGNGSIDVDVSGGIPPYVFDWSAGGVSISDEEDPEGLSAGEYTLVVTDANGCSFVLENVLVDNVLAVGEVAGRGHYRVFPNPAGDVCWIEWTGPTHGEVVVELLDLDGRAHLRAGLISSKQSLSIGNLPTGLYWLRLTDGKWASVQKLIISR
jgi:hypothetical protein